MPKAQSKKKKILIIDDEVSFTWLLKLNLEDAGDYDVEVENEPQKALGKVRSFAPDLIVLDLIMPGMRGDEVAAGIRADESLAQVPIVFLTATETREVLAEQDKLIRGNPVFAKPVNIDEVVELIEKQLPD